MKGTARCLDYVEQRGRSLTWCLVLPSPQELARLFSLGRYRRVVIDNESKEELPSNTLNNN